MRRDIRESCQAKLSRNPHVQPRRDGTTPNVRWIGETEDLLEEAKIRGEPVAYPRRDGRRLGDVRGNPLLEQCPIGGFRGLRGRKITLVSLKPDAQSVRRAAGAASFDRSSVATHS